MKIAYMFSGQGAQKNGMGKELYDNFPVVKKIFDDCDKILDFKITDICFEENELINDTQYTQPCLLVTSISIMELLKDVVKPDYLFGLSLGEYSALVASGALDLEESVRLVHNRGKFMNEAVSRLDETGMYAILNLDLEKLNSILEVAKKIGIVEISNYNTKGQIVAGGEMKALKKVEELVKESGGKAIKLNVSGPFHTSLLSEASENLNEYLKTVNFHKLNTKVVSNLTAKEVGSESELVNILTEQVKSSVKFQQSIEYLIQQGVDTFIELGPTKTLSTFVKKIDRSVKVLNIEDIDSYNKTMEYLKNNC